MMFLGPVAEAGAKRQKTGGKAVVAKSVKGKAAKARLAKANAKGKADKSMLAGAAKGRAGKAKLVADDDAPAGKGLGKYAKSKKYAKRVSARYARARSEADEAPRYDRISARAGASMRPISYAAPVAEAAAPAAQDLRVDYNNALVDRDLELRSAAALVVDQRTGEALYAKNPDVPSPIASITKLMTAIVTLDADLPLDEFITINLRDVDHLKGTGSRIPLGATFTRGELLHLALIASENRAAAALSRVYPGGREAFVEAMNRKAAELGMANTHYVDGTGLSSDNRASAADLARLVDAASRYPLIRQITTTGTYGVSVPGQRVVRVRENGRLRRVAMPATRNLAFVNTNALTRQSGWEIGVSKTGYINEAGHCLVMQARIAERKVIIVLLDSWGKMSRIGDATRIRHWLENGAAGRFASRRQAPPA
jgi:D-alanyl-D-alanine endopeptidase (penicillin-binding protein 7)